jgi:hypothetical protein
MELVAEGGVNGKGNIFNFMTFGAVVLYRKGGRPVVTGAAGRSLLHLDHGHAGIAGTWFEEFIVALAAAEHTEVEIMVKADGAETGDIYGDFADRMTAGAL